jgi:anti-sigma factor RsiW
MAEIIRLRGSPHEQAQQLLPWYVNGTLEADEAALVEAHLAECAECRADLAAEQASTSSTPGRH